MNIRNREKGSAVIPEASVSAVTAKAPKSSAKTDDSSDATAIRPPVMRFRTSGLNTSG